MLILMLAIFVSLIDKSFILLFESVRSLKLHIWNCVNVSFMLLLILTTVFSLIDKDFMLPLGSIIFLQLHTWNCVSVFFMHNIILPTVLYLLHTFIYIFRNRVVLLFILWILWLYSSTIKKFKCVVIISCWSKSYILSVLMYFYTFHMFMMSHTLKPL